MIIVGAGNLGQALADYAQFEKRGFKIIGLFDVNPVLKGVSVNGLEIRMVDELPEFIKKNQIEIATLTLPKSKALEMAKVLTDSGVKAIWNFAHTDLNLSVPSDVVVENVHLSESLMRLSYNLNRRKERRIKDAADCRSETDGRRLERVTIEEIGVSSIVLMERAALAVVEELKAHFDLTRVLLVCGSGNNGGDGIAGTENPSYAGIFRFRIFSRKKRIFYRRKQDSSGRLPKIMEFLR